MKENNNNHRIIEKCLFERLVEIKKEETPKIDFRINFDFNKFVESLYFTNVIRRGLMYGISERIKKSINIEK